MVLNTGFTVCLQVKLDPCLQIVKEQNEENLNFRTQGYYDGCDSD